MLPANRASFAISAGCDRPRAACGASHYGRRMSSSTLHEPAINVAAGVPMPMLGFGTWQIRGREAYDAVRTALDVGYRHVDTAALYENERSEEHTSELQSRCHLVCRLLLDKINYYLFIHMI